MKEIMMPYRTASESTIVESTQSLGISADNSIRKSFLKCFYAVRKMEHKMTIFETRVDKVMKMLQICNTTVGQKKHQKSILVE
jgi:hypothetical protein